jgi:hypothetical protein
VANSSPSLYALNQSPHTFRGRVGLLMSCRLTATHRSLHDKFSEFFKLESHPIYDLSDQLRIAT